jgi:hypothetical protein
VYAGVRFEPTHQLNALAAAQPGDWQARQARGTLTELATYGVQTHYPDLSEPAPDRWLGGRRPHSAQAVLQAVQRYLRMHGFPFPSQQKCSPESPAPEPGPDSSHDR